MAKRPQFGVLHYEGYLSIGVGDLYYREFGTGRDVLLGLHGGPGAAHDYLAPLTDVAGDDLRSTCTTSTAAVARTGQPMASTTSTP